MHCSAAQHRKQQLLLTQNKTADCWLEQQHWTLLFSPVWSNTCWHAQRGLFIHVVLCFQYRKWTHSRRYFRCIVSKSFSVAAASAQGHAEPRIKQRYSQLPKRLAGWRVGCWSYCAVVAEMIPTGTCHGYRAATSCEINTQFSSYSDIQAPEVAAETVIWRLVRHFLRPGYDFIYFLDRTTY